MNEIEKVLMHALFVHLHHNIDQAINFIAIEMANEVSRSKWPGCLKVGPADNDDAAVFRLGCEEDDLIVAKMESHCSPCVVRPYDAAATGAGGAMRDIVAMGGIPMYLLDFIGTRPLDQEVIVGTCGFKGECTCGECEIMTSKKRVDLMMKGIRDMCCQMDVAIVGGGFSTSFSDIVPAVVAAVIGKLITKKPLTKPAKNVDDLIILIGEKTGSDGNDTLYRAGMVDEMKPAIALFEEEKTSMEAMKAIFKSAVEISACSDLGAAGIGAAVSESVRFGGFGADIDLALVSVKEENITPEEILICETQGRYVLQVKQSDAGKVLFIAREAGATAQIIGQITNDDKQIFRYRDKVVAEIPNNPSPEALAELRS